MTSFTSTPICLVHNSVAAGEAVNVSLRELATASSKSFVGALGTLNVKRFSLVDVVEVDTRSPASNLFSRSISSYLPSAMRVPSDDVIFKSGSADLILSRLDLLSDFRIVVFSTTLLGNGRNSMDLFAMFHSKVKPIPARSIVSF